MDYVYLTIGAAAFAGIAPLFFGITRADIVHIAFVGSFGLCGAAIALQTLVTWKPRFRLPILIVWVFIGILVITNLGAKTVMTYRSSREMKGRRDEILKLGMASWVDANLGQNGRIITAFGGLQYLYIRRAAVGLPSCHLTPLFTTAINSGESWEGRF
jgi:hypothetical protein